jgi:hypothetical protein
MPASPIAASLWGIHEPTRLFGPFISQTLSHITGQDTIFGVSMCTECASAVHRYPCLRCTEASFGASRGRPLTKLESCIAEYHETHTQSWPLGGVEGMLEGSRNPCLQHPKRQNVGPQAGTCWYISGTLSPLPNGYFVTPYPSRISRGRNHIRPFGVHCRGTRGNPKPLLSVHPRPFWYISSTVAQVDGKDPSGRMLNQPPTPSTPASP